MQLQARVLFFSKKHIGHYLGQILLKIHGGIKKTPKSKEEACFEDAKIRVKTSHGRDDENFLKPTLDRFFRGEFPRFIAISTAVRDHVDDLKWPVNRAILN